MSLSTCKRLSDSSAITTLFRDSRIDFTFSYCNSLNSFGSLLDPFNVNSLLRTLLNRLVHLIRRFISSTTNSTYIELISNTTLTRLRKFGYVLEPTYISHLSANLKWMLQG